VALLVCRNCKRVYQIRSGGCPGCGAVLPAAYNFRNSDEYLRREVPRVVAERKRLGLEGLVGGLAAVIINTERRNLRAAAQELVDTTGLAQADAFRDETGATYVLSLPGSADVLVRSRTSGKNPFAAINRFPKSSRLPATRLETFVFEVRDLDRYAALQRSRGVRFMSAHPVRGEGFSFIQTRPSIYTGNSLGFIERHGAGALWRQRGSDTIGPRLVKPRRKHLTRVMEIDHAATRVHAADRDAAIIEFMELTSYRFDFALYIDTLNSITNVARLGDEDFAMVFTSGISPYVDEEHSGPTEKFIRNYGTRVHHLAFRTERIEEVFAALKRGGMTFLIELVGSRREGLKQTFSAPSRRTMLVTEYIHRFGRFDGFFTKSNVTLLTRATGRQ
jgi:4-hydroxyphenylpyruvate dioxygenase-like putative hemolysin